MLCQTTKCQIHRVNDVHCLGQMLSLDIMFRYHNLRAINEVRHIVFNIRL